MARLYLNSLWFNALMLPAAQTCMSLVLWPGHDNALAAPEMVASLTIAAGLTAAALTHRRASFVFALLSAGWLLNLEAMVRNFIFSFNVASQNRYFPLTIAFVFFVMWFFYLLQFVKPEALLKGTSFTEGRLVLKDGLWMRKAKESQKLLPLQDKAERWMGLAYVLFGFFLIILFSDSGDPRLLFAFVIVSFLLLVLSGRAASFAKSLIEVEIQQKTVIRMDWE